MKTQDKDLRMDKIESLCGDMGEPWRAETIKHLNLVEESRDTLKSSILMWWDKHQFDVYSDGEEEYNLYDKEPKFVTLAKLHSPATKENEK